MLLNKYNTNLCLSKVGFLVYLGLLNPAIVQCVQLPPATTATTPKQTVAFKLSNSSGSEAVSIANLGVNLSDVSNQTIAVDYAITNSTANQTNHSSGKDYTLKQGTLTFSPGVTNKNIPISIVNDSISEADETLAITLFNPKNAVMGDNTSHIYTIVDNDRRSVINVKKDFKAAGNGITDDTKAIQEAIDRTYARGGGVIVFPPGIYIVKSVNIKENITYQGYGATIKRPPNQDKSTRTFTTENLYSENVSSKPLIVKGLTFDGNSKKQGPYKNYELEQAHLLFLTANPNSPKRLKAIVEDCIFKNGVADGISIYTNVDVKVFNCKAINVFRGGFVLTGGYSSAKVYKLVTQGKIDNTGIDIEVDGEGYGGTLKVDVKLENLNLIDGDFDIAVLDGSSVVGKNITADAPFYIANLNSTMRFTNSTFKVGGADGYLNRIVFPGKLTFENCVFYVTKKKTGRSYDFLSTANVWWQHSSYGTQRNQLLVFNDCQFRVDKNIKSTDKTYAIYLEEDEKENNNILKINRGSISKEFDFKVFKQGEE